MNRQISNDKSLAPALSARWAKDQQATPSIRLNQTPGDKLCNQLPTLLWPRIPFLFYMFARIEVALLLVALFAPRARFRYLTA